MENLEADVPSLPVNIASQLWERGAPWCRSGMKLRVPHLWLSREPGT